MDLIQVLILSRKKYPKVIYPHQQSSLSVGKISAEYICNYFREFKNLETKIARCFSFGGEGIPTDLHYAIGNFVVKPLKTNIVIKGDGMAVRSYMDLDDLQFGFHEHCFLNRIRIFTILVLVKRYQYLN